MAKWEFGNRVQLLGGPTHLGTNFSFGGTTGVSVGVG
eukprot:SAG31_NODE_16950_length_689_cov_1.269492_1_plen_36_part_01